MTHTLEFVVRHGYLLVFLWVLAEQGGLPAPSLPLLLACGALAHDGRLSAPWIVLTGAAACLTADSFWFLLGRRRGVKVLRLICRLSLEPDSCVRQTETAFQRYGSRSLLVAKFIPGFSAISAPMAAIVGVRFGRFIAFDLGGALVWISSYCALGWLFRKQLDRVGDFAERMGSWLAVLLIALLGAWIAWKFIQRRRFLRKLAVSRITAQDLRARLDAGEKVVVVDVRSPLESDFDAVPGALRIPLEELETRHLDIPRDRDIILFCS
ncbi:MAG TPA: VTT domain-containing protein [Bryobacteraceae bacterium]|nr:VTT domain-containing protein [Bryobacteraceae bacterium]